MVGMLGHQGMSAPGSGGSQRAHGFEHIGVFKVIVLYLFFVPSATATLTRTTLHLDAHGILGSQFLT